MSAVILLPFFTAPFASALFELTSLCMALHSETGQKHTWSSKTGKKRDIFNHISSPITHVHCRAKEEAVWGGEVRASLYLFRKQLWTSLLLDP